MNIVRCRDDTEKPILNSTEVNNTEFLNEFLDGAYDNSSYVDSIPSFAEESQVYIPYASIGKLKLSPNRSDEVVTSVSRLTMSR